MSENKITLLISGNKIGNAGFDELLNVGDFPLGLEDIDYPINFEASHCFYIQHTASYRKLVLMCKPSTIVSSGAARPGRLSIGIVIPKGLRIIGGKSPYDLLLEIKNKFMESNMNFWSSTGVYEFKNGYYDNQPFEEILNKYPLEKGSSRHIVTAGEENAYMIASEDKIRDLLRDPQYAEFANYKFVWVCSQGNPQNYPNIVIPRPHKYEVYINDKFDSSIGENDSYDKDIRPNANTSHPVSVSFTIDKLRNGYTQENVSFSLNEDAERVDCWVTFPKKRYTRCVNARFSPEITPEDKAIIKSQLKLKAGNGDVRSLEWDNGVDKATATFIGNEISLDWKLDGDSRYTYNDYNFNFSAEAINSESPVNILKKKQRILVQNVSHEILHSNSPLQVRIKVAYQANADVALTKKSDSSSLYADVDYSLVDLSSLIEKISFVWTDEKYIISDDYKYHYERESRTLKIYDLKTSRKVALTPPPAGVSAQQYGSQGYSSPTTQKSEGGKVRTLTIKCNGEHPKTDVYIKLQDNKGRDLYSIAKTIKKDENNDIIIECPANTKPKSIHFKADGYHKDERPIDHNCNQIQMPTLDKLSFWDKLEERRAFLTLLAIACICTLLMGIFIPNPKISLTKPYVTFAQKPTDSLLLQKEELIKQLQDSIKNVNTKNSDLKKALETKTKAEDQTKQADNTTASTPPAHSQQAQLNKYIQQCEDASLPFADIDEMQKFVDDLKADAAKLEGYDKLQFYTKVYRDALTFFENIQKCEYKDLTQRDEDGKSILKKTEGHKQALLSFRKAVGTLYICHPDNPKTPYNDEEAGKDYIKNIFNDGGIIKNATSLSSLIEIRDEWIKNKYNK